MSAVIPKTFEEWKRCIEHDCGIQLKRAYIEQRLTILRESHHEETRRFIQIYGEEHWQLIVDCFERMEKQP